MKRKSGNSTGFYEILKILRDSSQGVGETGVCQDTGTPGQEGQ